MQVNLICIIIISFCGIDFESVNLTKGSFVSASKADATMKNECVLLLFAVFSLFLELGMINTADTTIITNINEVMDKSTFLRRFRR